MRRFRPIQFVQGVVVLVMVAAAAGLGYRFVRADLAASVYRERLENLATEYEDLRTTYNEAVRRTAVTELVVADGELSVHVRSAAGVLNDIPTPFDPSGEIYVDYVVLDGRLWIRRVFDARTAPGDGLVIDPVVAEVDWDSEAARHGKAVYRRLGEGRWVVTVTGHGSLGLERADGPAELVPAPEVNEYAEETEQADDEVGRLGPADVWAWVTGR
jgi:hypothetical protein